jgi:hypothetical protein
MFFFFQKENYITSSSLLFSTEYWFQWFLLNNRKDMSFQTKMEIEIEISKKMMFSIKEFFILTTYYENKHKKTRKQIKSIKEISKIRSLDSLQI